MLSSLGSYIYDASNVCMCQVLDLLVSISPCIDVPIICICCYCSKRDQTLTECLSNAVQQQINIHAATIERRKLARYDIYFTAFLVYFAVGTSLFSCS